jgi:D-beta-D-heptose 7-phosphate kinase/D-beta-D-heptose 1-phosphate adenosyltransferase
MTISDLLSRFAMTKLMVVGDVMLDSYWHGVTSRISPEAPVPIVRVENEEARLGGAGNVALNSSVLGAQTRLLGLVGSDSIADQVQALLQSGGVVSQLQRVPGSKTITKLRIVSRHQQLIRLDFEDHFPKWDAEALLSDFTAQLTDVDIVILSDYSKGALRSSTDLISAARAARKQVIIDPKGTDFERYRGATLITPNLSEFEAVVGKCNSDADIEARGVVLRDQLDLEAILITRSENGMTLLARGHEPRHLPTRAQEVFDVTGAGDTVVATLGVAIGSGLSLYEAVTLSNIAAGIVVSKLGTATVSPTELVRVLQGGTESHLRCVFEEDDVLIQIETARGKGERIVMTNGCFDILHPGHIDYLEKAKALGDRLVVAVNDDSSVRRLKGESRPINTLSTRMRMLSALACVDWVVPFKEDTPNRLYCKLLPDVLVKGGDYTEDQVAGAECVKAAGGQVQILDFLDGHSTSALITKIREEH